MTESYDPVQEIEALGRVYHRLVETPPGPPFYSVISQLLPRLLHRIGQNHQHMLESETSGMSLSDSHGSKKASLKELYDNIHAKYLDMLTHIMKRVRPDETCKVPCEAIVYLLVDRSQMKMMDPATLNSFTVNFSLAFLTIGVIRCSPEEAQSILPLILVMAGYYCRRDIVSPADRGRSSQVAHMLIRILGKIVEMKSLKASKPDPLNYMDIEDQTEDAVNDKLKQNQYIELTQCLLREDSVNIAVYDLLLDVLLYQSMPVNSDLPPPGLSSYGHERLKSGSSVIAKDWRDEYSTTNRLVELKKMVLEWIAPFRRWDPFLASTNNGLPVHISRVLTLLVVAMGDSHIDVSDRAESYLRVFFDRQDRNQKVLTGGSKRDLLVDLLSLCLGGVGANRIKNVIDNTDVRTMRRMISEKSVLSVLNFIAQRILDRQQESPFTNRLDRASPTDFMSIVELISSMIHYVVSSYFQNSFGKSFTTFSQFHYKNVPAASGHVLNILCSHLSTLYDEEKKMDHQLSLNQLQKLLARALALACNHVSCAATDYSADTSKTVGIESRTGCYAVISTVCRSTAVLDNKSIILELTNEDQPLGPLSLRDASTTVSESISSHGFSIAQILFGCVAYEDNAIRLNAMASLDALLSVTIKSFCLSESTVLFLSKPFQAAATSLIPCIWNAAKQKKSKVARVAAANWTRDFICLFDQISAFHVLCFLAGDDDESVSTTACSAFAFIRDIGEEKYKCPLSLPPGVTCPKFTNVIHTFLKKRSYKDMLPSYVEFSPQSKEVTLHLCWLCYELHNDNDEDSLSSFYFILIDTLTNLVSCSTIGKGELDLMDAACSVLSQFLSSSKTMRLLASGSLDEIINLLLRLTSTLGQFYLASAIFHLLSDIRNDQSNVNGWLVRVKFQQTIEYCLLHLNSHGAILVAANYVKAYRFIQLSDNDSLTWPWTLCAQVTSALCDGVLNSNDSIAVTCTKSLGIALSVLDSEDPYHRALFLSDHDNLEYMNQTALLRTSALKKLNDSFSVASSASNRLYALVRSVGLIMAGTSPANVEAIINNLFDLLSLRNVHQDQLLAIYVGESLACANSSKIIFQRLMNVELKSSVYQKRNSLALCLLAMLTAALHMILIGHSHSFVDDIMINLTDIHRYSFSILADSRCSPIARESSCLCLVVCRSLAKMQSTAFDVWKDLSVRLMAASSNLTEALTTNGNVNDNQRRVEDSDLLTVLRVFATVAIEINHPNVFYSLAVVSVAASNQFWDLSWCREHYNGYKLMRDDWLDTTTLRSIFSLHVIKILPTLLIARYDPDKNASVIMNKVWSILQSDNDQTLSLTTHFRHLVDVLIENTTSKIWRRRVASCKALADIIVGRSWSDFGGGNGYFDEDDLLFEQAASSGNASSRLIRLINVTLRSLDDVRLAVREAGESLSLNVKNVIVNLCKRSGEHVDLNKDSEVSPDASATATFLPYLIKVGLNQSCAEAIQFSIVCLIEIIDTGSPIQIHSYIPSLIGSLLMSLSGLEPALLSHLQARAAGDAPGTERDVEQLRLRLADRSSLTSAITKVLNMVPALDLESQRLVVFQLDQALRSSHGLTTRNSVIDAIVSLCCKCPNAFDANPSTTRLLNALFAAIDHERKDTLMRGKFAYALGFVANLASAKTVRFLALKVCNSYLNNSDSLIYRKSAASTIKSIISKASRHLEDGGPNDIWRRRVLPISFIGQNDEMEIGSIWKDVWDEGCSIIMSQSGGQGVILEERILPGLIASTISLLRDKSWFFRKMACNAIMQLSRVLSPPTSTQIECIRMANRMEASAIIIASGVGILAKKQLWTGKEALVSVVVTIACHWLPIPAQETAGIMPLDCYAGTKQLEKINIETTTSLSSFDTNTLFYSSVDPTQRWPISANGSWNDLLDGDNWFQRSVQLEDKEDDNGILTNIVHENSSEVLSECESLYPEKTDDSDKGKEYEKKYVGGEVVKAMATVTGIVHCLLDQATLVPNNMVLGLSEAELLPYKASVLENLCVFLNTVQTTMYRKCHISEDLYLRTYETLTAYMMDSVDGYNTPPILIARAISCVASSLWYGIEDFSELFSQLNLQSKHVAWTVRESSTLAAEKLVTRASIQSLRKMDVLECMVSLALDAFRERKYYRIRLAGLQLISSLCDRGNQEKSKNTSTDSSLEALSLLHALLPFKERILNVARKCLVDDDATVIDAASKLCTQLSQWP